MASSFNKGIINRYNTFSCSSAITLTMEQSGSVLFLDMSSAFTITLPSVTDNAGSNFKFIITAGTETLTINSSNYASLSSGKAIECVTDGTTWYIIELN